MEVKYFVRTTKDRNFNYDLNYELIIDKEYKPIISYIDSLYEINDYNSVLLEDDLVLCKNFKEEIEKIIVQYPNKIINFFQHPNSFYTSQFTTDFNFNQCTYFPKGITKTLADEMTKLYSRGPYFSYGMLLNQALKLLGISHLAYRPCLVQHIDNLSIFSKGKKLFRNTIYFKDYLDELNIKMEDAFTLENQKKLNELLEKDRNIWCNINNN